MVRPGSPFFDPARHSDRSGHKAAKRRNPVAGVRCLFVRPSRDPLYLVEQPPVLWFRWRKRAGDR